MSEARPRTLFVSPDFPPDRGGIATLYQNLLTRFPAGSVEVSTVRAPAWPAAPDEPSGSGGRDGHRDDFPFPVSRMPFGFRECSRLQNVARWTLHARRLVRERGYSAAQIGTLRPAGSIGAWLRRLEGLPFLVYVHGKDVLKELGKVERSRLYGLTARDVLSGAGAVVANSRFTAGLVCDLADAAGAPEVASRVRVVHPGADPERFRPGEEGVAELRARFALGDSRVALTVARLEARKGVDRTIEALASLAAEHPDVTYVVVGDGPERDALERRAASAGLADRVRFTGDVPDRELPVWYRLADVFLLPSRRESSDEVEGFGIVLSEAGASGIPVIGGVSGGIPEAVIEGETGFLVDPNEPLAIAAALRRLLGDPALALRLGRGGRAAVERHFNWDRAAREAWAIVEEVA